MPPPRRAAEFSPDMARRRHAISPQRHFAAFDCAILRLRCRLRMPDAHIYAAIIFALFDTPRCHATPPVAISPPAHVYALICRAAAMSHGQPFL